MGSQSAHNSSWPDYLQDPQLEPKLREQLNHGCRLARQLDERLRSIPEGKLLLERGGYSSSTSSQLQAAGTGDVSAPALDISIAMAAAEVVGAFNEAVKLLLQGSASSATFRGQMGAQSPTFSAANSPRQAAALRSSSSPSVQPSLTGKQLASAIEPVQLSVPLKSPPLSPRSFSVTPRNTGANTMVTRKLQGQPLYSSMQNSTIASGAATSTPCSPPGSNIQYDNSLLRSVTTSDMSEGSPKARPQYPLPHVSVDLSADEGATTSANPPNADISRKRKSLPKTTLRMAAVNVESAEINTPPDDGHTWRKYGQKEIHGALHPRSYYRCTHKTDMGCPAVKQVQRCDEKESLFDVTYRGHHTCRPAELEHKYWPLAFPRGLSSLVNLPTDMGSTSALQELSSLLSVSESTAMSAAASLMLGRLSATQHFRNVASMANSSASRLPVLAGGCSTAGATSMNQLGGSLLANEVRAGVINSEISRRDVVISSDDAVQQQLHAAGGGSGDEVSIMSRYNIMAQLVEQGRVFTPLADWPSSSDQLQRSTSEALYQRPFTKAGSSYSSSMMAGRSSASERLVQPGIPRSYGEGSNLLASGGSTTAGSSSTSMQMNAGIRSANAHNDEQNIIHETPVATYIDAVGVSSSELQPGPPAAHMQVDDQDHRFVAAAGSSCSTPQLITLDDMDINDNLLSDYI